MVGVFRTNISTGKEKIQVIEAICNQFDIQQCSIDLDDCDKVLRILSNTLEEDKIILFVQKLGYQCTPLD